METTLELSKSEKAIIEVLSANPTGITLNTLFGKIQKVGFRSKKILIKNLNRLDSIGIVSREQYDWKIDRGKKRLIKLTSEIKKIEKDAKDFKKYLKGLLKLAKYKLKVDPNYNVNNLLDKVTRRLIGDILYNMASLRKLNARKYLFQAYFESIESFVFSLSSILPQQKYKYLTKQNFKDYGKKFAKIKKSKQ
jgi:DNA-binding HxlR family transcriptional regulator